MGLNQRLREVSEMNIELERQIAAAGTQVSIGGKRASWLRKGGPHLHFPIFFDSLRLTFTEKGCLSLTHVSVGCRRFLLYGFTMCENVCNALGSNRE